MIKKGSLYSASDKAFFDALCQQKMSKPALQELLWRRGIIRSNKTEKDDIARHFSRLEHDYFDHKTISEKVSSGSNREKQTFTFLNPSLSLEDLGEVARELVNDRKELDNKIDYTTTKRSVNIDVSYSYYDHNRPEFKQLVTKNATVSLEFLDDGLSIRAPANEYISDITASLLSKIKEKSTDDDFDVESISLYGIDDIDSRNEFFQRLIEGLENMEVVNVPDVAVYNPVTGDDDAIGVHVKKASLNGDGILNAGELKQFYKKGFFVYRISWSAKFKDNPHSDIYNFQAQFNDPEYCRNFSYICKGFLKHLEGSTHTKTPSRLPQSTELQMLRLLEKSSRKAKDFIYNSGLEGETDDNSEK